jgi:hypothetical protein
MKDAKLVKEPKFGIFLMLCQIAQLEKSVTSDRT